MICIPISATTNEDMLALVNRAEKEPADLYEFRFDYLAELPRVERLVAAASRPVMATCRSAKEGGHFRGSAAERRSILQRAGLAGAAYLDVEPADIAAVEGYGKATRIVSIHNFHRTPADLDSLVDTLAATQAEWIKFAVAARFHVDNLKVFAALAKSPKPAIAVAMGEIGLVSRIMGCRFGSRVTFGSIDTGLESAPGQITAADLANLYRVHGIGEGTQLHGYLGHPDYPTKGHVIHNRAFANAGMDAVCIPFPARDAMEFLKAIPSGLGLHRLAVDDVHGRAALAWAGDATANAARTGRANVLLNMNGYWLADNTELPSTSESTFIRVAARGARAR